MLLAAVCHDGSQLALAGAHAAVPELCNILDHTATPLRQAENQFLHWPHVECPTCHCRAKFSLPLLCHPWVLTVVSSGSQIKVASLGLAEQQAHQLSGADGSLQCNGQFDDMHASPLGKEEGTCGCSPGASEMASRLPTQQEIQHMNELDLSINLGYVLVSGCGCVSAERERHFPSSILPLSSRHSGRLLCHYCTMLV